MSKKLLTSITINLPPRTESITIEFDNPEFTILGYNFTIRYPWYRRPIPKISIIRPPKQRKSKG